MTITIDTQRVLHVEPAGMPMTTAQAARLAGLSGPKALRRLEARGVVDAPHGRSAAKGYRIYTQDDVAELRAQLAARSLGGNADE